MSQPRLAKHALAAELAAVQQRYRTLFETLPLGVIYYAADGLITAANPAASEMIGVDASDMLTWPTAPGWHAVREDGTPFPTQEVPVAAALRTVERRNQVADLRGVDVYVYGVHAAHKDVAYWQSLRTFWARYFAESGAALKCFSVMRDVADFGGMQQTVAGR